MTSEQVKEFRDAVTEVMHAMCNVCNVLDSIYCELEEKELEEQQRTENEKEQTR